MNNDESIFNGALDLLGELRTQIESGKVDVQAYSVTREHQTFVYTVRVHEPYKNSTL
jgi:hypothetical protein